jgi:VWFA-related protein
MIRKIAFLLTLASLAPQAFAAKHITVEQLEQALATAQGKPDADVARQLSDLELTERLSPAELSHWQTALPGEQTRLALVALADASEFRDPPAAEIPSAPAPDFDAQRNILALTVNYVSRAIPQLPNFFATRVTTSFEDTPLLQGSGISTTPFKALHPIGNSSATMLYRDGREKIVGPDAGKERNTHGLTTKGVFGPILGIVLLDAAQSKLVWNHWEQGASGLQAVFSYSVPKEKSHYTVDYCCVADEAATANNNNNISTRRSVQVTGGAISTSYLHRFSQIAAYHGEMTVDPATGTILRLMLLAELKPDDPITKAGIVVEYGSVEIAGKTYICPLRSVSSTLAQTLQFDPVFLNPLANQQQPLKTSLDDVAFEQYHVFRAEAVIVANDAESTDSSHTPDQAGAATAGAASGNANDSGSPVAAEAPVTSIANQSGLPPAPASNGAQDTTAGSTPAPPIEPAVAEVSVAQATEMPDAPAHQSPSIPANGFTLRATTRLVDVGVVAFDKKGHPITDLKAADFEIYDNGRKQELKYFSQAASGASEPLAASFPSPATEPEQTAVAESQSAFSNRRTAADAKTAETPSASNSTILMIDGSNLAFSDLTHARVELMQFLQALPAGERVGLYAMDSTGFRILAEETTDHALIEAKLGRWMPTAQDLARAQDEEQRNRQQIEEVHSVEDLSKVNGNETNDPDLNQQFLDPQLRDFGSNPGRDTLTILVGVARHLASLPGHKSLVWVTSDNVLADWNKDSVTIEKGSKSIERFALRAQEAMNDAHVSVYPLDASQLEGGAIEASTQHRNVELTPMELDKANLLHTTGAQASTEGQDVAIGRDMRPGRVTAQMQQDIHPIQGAFREVAEATGGRVFRRSGSIAVELNGVVNDGHAAYLLSFTPDQPADDRYHLLTIKLAGRHDISLRYRTGYQYSKEPATIRDRFREAVWQPTDVGEVALTAKPMAASKGGILKLNVAATDLDLAQQEGFWAGKLDIFLVQRDDAGLRAQVSGQTIGLRLKPATYQELMRDGIPLMQSFEIKPNTASVRAIVVDENSGRMGSVTVPVAALALKP